MKITKKEFNVQTGEETITQHDETASETKERLDFAKKVAAQQAEAEANATAKAELLAMLGITADEATLLLS